MKLNKNKLYISLILILLGALIYNITISQINYSKYSNEIELLDDKNDRLVKNLINNELIINRLTLRIDSSKIAVMRYRNELDSLYLVSKYNKNKYNEKINTINSISNRELTLKFTETFNTR